MNDVDKFLAHAVALERDAARRYEDLAASMGTDGNAELRAFFARMAHFSRLHLAEAQARAGFRTLPVLGPGDFDWPEGIPPETAEWAGVDPMMDAADALALALDGERRGHAFYATIAALSTDHEVRTLAAEFAAEEAQHVAELEKLAATAAR
ncbi:ferritin family protein [Rubrivivax gelatinosus]|uniref:Rubrerythrin n=1 Tax=Rubrivivax gelatinosus TaxID=28068 RepID=A0ABS1DQY5_RUBGE|nr:rubrerythrin [Rubrivivax gelatinosus]MBK1711814.1 rubrerythrin [Rubrivivax gelatinosus]